MAGRISVVINAYVHRRFLEEALASAVAQESRRPLDIVILSPDPDFNVPAGPLKAATDRSHTIRTLLIPAGPAGVGLKAAAQAAQGDFLAILDDDDLWEPGKIAWVEEAVANTPEVGYLHNSQRFVDGRNRPLGPMNPHRLIRHPSSLAREGRRCTIDPADPGSVALGMSFAPDFNNSSCVVERAALLESPIVERVARGEDSFLFYTALLRGRPMALTSDRLTRYRIHALASTTGRSPVAAGSGMLPGYLAYVDDHLHMIRLVLEQVPAHDDRAVREWLLHELAFWTILHGIANGRLREEEGARSIRTLLGGGRIRPRSRELYAGLLGAWGLAAPATALAGFRAWRLAW